MGTKVGLTGITFGDATVQNTAAVTGVTSLTAGSGISLSGSTGAVTVTNSAQGTTYSAGNGLSLSSTTFSVAAPGFNTVGSYCFITFNATFASGSNYSAGAYNTSGIGSGAIGASSGTAVSNNLSGTWKYLGAPTGGGESWNAIACRVS